ncbi:MAG: hypothetical protein PSV16_11070 [Flavobacterium sp.]|nr:hypothetical protein [Flavobacterium sp.]
MMRNILTVIGVILCLSCGGNSIAITEVPNDYDAKIMPYDKSEDSLNVFIPISYRIKNNDFHNIVLWSFNQKSCKDYTYRMTYTAEGIGFDAGLKGERKIPAQSSVLYTFVVSALIAKSDIDSSYWYNKSLSEMSRTRDKLTSNLKNMQSPKFRQLYHSLDTDSIAFTFREENGNMIIKSAKLHEDKYNTISAATLKKEDYEQSIYRQQK